MTRRLLAGRLLRTDPRVQCGASSVVRGSMRVRSATTCGSSSRASGARGKVLGCAARYAISGSTVLDGLLTTWASHVFVVKLGPRMANGAMRSVQVPNGRRRRSTIDVAYGVAGWIHRNTISALQRPGVVRHGVEQARFGWQGAGVA